MKADYPRTEHPFMFIDSSEAQRIATKIKAGGAMECSAKDNENIDEVIDLAVQTLILARCPKAPSCNIL